MSANSPAFNPAHSLATHRIAAGTIWHHIFPDRHPDPLGFGLSPSRFSDPRRRNKNRFGVYYVGGTFEVAFLETLVRDRRNYNPGSLIIATDELRRYVHVPIIIEQPLYAVVCAAETPSPWVFRPTPFARDPIVKDKEQALRFTDTMLVPTQYATHPA